MLLKVALFAYSQSIISSRDIEAVCRDPWIVPCKQRDQYLRTPARTKTPQVSFFQGKADGTESFTDKMKARIDSPEGQAKYGRRFATVEPVFGNLRHNKQLNRFKLRGQRTVDGLWKLYCSVPNIEKLAHHCYAQ